MRYTCRFVVIFTLRVSMFLYSRRAGCPFSLLNLFPGLVVVVLAQLLSEGALLTSLSPPQLRIWSCFCVSRRHVVNWRHHRRWGPPGLEEKLALTEAEAAPKRAPPKPSQPSWNQPAKALKTSQLKATSRTGPANVGLQSSTRPRVLPKLPSFGPPSFGAMPLGKSSASSAGFSFGCLRETSATMGSEPRWYPASPGSLNADSAGCGSTPLGGSGL